MTDRLRRPSEASKMTSWSSPQAARARVSSDEEARATGEQHRRTKRAWRRAKADIDAEADLVKAPNNFYKKLEVGSHKIAK